MWKCFCWLSGDARYPLLGQPLQYNPPAVLHGHIPAQQVCAPAVWPPGQACGQNLPLCCPVWAPWALLLGCTGRALCLSQLIYQCCPGPHRGQTGRRWCIAQLRRSARAARDRWWPGVRDSCSRQPLSKKRVIVTVRSAIAIEARFTSLGLNFFCWNTKSRLHMVRW